MITNFDTFIVEVQDAVVKKYEEVKQLHTIAITALDGEHSPRALPLCIKACEDYTIAKDQLKALHDIFDSRIVNDLREDTIRDMATWAGIRREFRSE